MRSIHLALVTSSLLIPASALALSGGPDDFGYSYIDSDEAGGPVYSWTDISKTGTATGIDDDGEEVISLPFTFWFYGSGYSQVTVGDGVLLFGNDNEIYNRNECLPGSNDDGDDSMILALWDDLEADAVGAGDVYWEVLGKSPERQLVVQYDNVPHYGSSSFYTFQAILVETTNEILLQYASLDSKEKEYLNGASATVGIQAALSGPYLEYMCETDDVLYEGLAVSFDAVCEDLDGDGLGACDGDCDDDDPTIGPTATELDDGLDNDCDGLLDEDFVAVGDLVITEMMPEPVAVAEQRGEWFELKNVSSRDIDMQGWTISDSDGFVVIDESVLVVAGEYALFAARPVSDYNGNLPEVDWAFDWDDMHLNNAGDDLIISMGGTVIDELSYLPPEWPVTEGGSLYLDPGYIDAQANDDPVGWCAIPFEIEYDYGGAGTGDYGTPGEENPAGLCCHDDDGDGWDVCDGDCDDEDPNLFPENPEVADLADNDCDGLADEDWVAEGTIVISEFMDDPYAAATVEGEWFEIHNAGEVDLNLLNWVVQDELGESFVIDSELIVPAGGYALLAAAGDAEDNGNLPDPDFVYSYDEFSLESYAADSLQLFMGELAVSRVDYENVGDWPSELGRSTYLCPGLESSGGSSELGDWAATPADASLDYGGQGTGDYGTPAAANPDDVDGDGYSACDGDCEDGDASVNPEGTEDCDNGLDDDCDGATDGDDEECGGTGPSDSDPPGDSEPPDGDDTGQAPADTAGDGDKDGDCEGCAGGGAGAGLLALLLAGTAIRRRMRHG